MDKQELDDINRDGENRIVSLKEILLEPWNEGFKRLAEKNIATDRCFNIIPHPDNNLKITGDWNYQVRQVHDMYTNLQFKENILLKPGRALLPFITKEQIPELIDAVNYYRYCVPKVSYTDYDFRKTFGLWKLSNNDVLNLHEKYVGLKLDGTCYAYYDPEDPEHKWHQVRVIGVIAEIAIETTGRFNPGRKKPGKKEPGKKEPKEPEPEHRYTFVPGMAGVLFFQVLNQGKTTLLKKEFYHYKPSEQNIIRYCSQWPFLTTKISPRLMARLMEWQQPENSMEIWWLVDAATKRLKEMKEKRLIWKGEPKMVKGKIEFWVTLKYPYRCLPPKIEPEEPDDILSFGL